MERAALEGKRGQHRYQPAKLAALALESIGIALATRAAAQVATQMVLEQPRPVGGGELFADGLAVHAASATLREEA